MAQLQREFIDTEKSFIKALKTLMFIADRARKRKIFSQEEYDTLFPAQLIRLVEMHDDFLANLKRLDQPFNIIVSKFIPRLQVYVKYLINHPNASALVTKYRNDPQFNSFMQECQKKLNVDSDEKVYVDLDSLLIAPVQRLPRYELLIRDLASCLRADTVDHKETVALLKTIMQTNESINNEVKSKENDDHLSAVEQKLTRWGLLGEGFSLKDKKPTRWYLREGPVSVRKKLIVEGLLSRDNATPHVPFMDRYLFLFDDLAIETKKKGNTYLIKRVYNISQNLEILKSANSDDDALGLKSTEGKEFFIKFPQPEKLGWYVDFKKCREGGFGLKRLH